ncbi:MAG: hypothetical protein V7784_04955 [Oceanospirillaceae bacterium]
MIKFINILGMTTGLIMLIIAAADFVPNYFVVIGLALVIGSFLSDRSRAKRKNEKVNAQIQARIEQLISPPWQDEKVLIIKAGVRHYWLITIGLGLCLWALYFQISNSITNWLIFILAVIIGPILLLDSIKSLSFARKPFLSLSKGGFCQKPYDFIKWQDVEKILFEENPNKGLKVSILTIVVKQYHGKIHWTERLLGLIGLKLIQKGKVIFKVNHLTEAPEVVAAVSYHLWKYATK